MQSTTLGFRLVSMHDNHTRVSHANKQLSSLCPPITSPQHPVHPDQLQPMALNPLCNFKRPPRRKLLPPNVLLLQCEPLWLSKQQK